MTKFKIILFLGASIGVGLWGGLRPKDAPAVAEAPAITDLAAARAAYDGSPAQAEAIAKFRGPDTSQEDENLEEWMMLRRIHDDACDAHRSAC